MATIYSQTDYNHSVSIGFRDAGEYLCKAITFSQRIKIETVQIRVESMAVDPSVSLRIYCHIYKGYGPNNLFYPDSNLLKVSDSEIDDTLSSGTPKLYTFTFGSYIPDSGTFWVCLTNNYRIKTGEAVFSVQKGGFFPDYSIVCKEGTGSYRKDFCPYMVIEGYIYSPNNMEDLEQSQLVTTTLRDET